MLRRLALAAALLASLPAYAQLPDTLNQALAANGIPADAVGMLVLRGNEVVVAHNANQAMAPASTMKVVTTMVGLEQLGPVFRGRTELRSSGEVKNGVLKGDLIVRGGADMDLSGEALENLLRALRYQGIRKIAGDIVFDRELFNPARSDIGLAPFDESPEAYYNVIPDALLINKNMLQIDMRSSGKKLKLEMQPALDRVSITSDMRLIDGDCAKWEDGWKLPEALTDKAGRIKVVLHGTFPRNCIASNSINVVDRNDYLDRLLRLKWKQLGGTISGQTVEGHTPADAALLASHVSRSLPELVRDINKPSDNTLARTVFLSLGSLESDPVLGSHPLPAVQQTTFVRSDQAVRGWMRAHQIDDTGLVLENGSGLSRIERITPRQMGGILEAGLSSNWAPEFQSSLPIVAVDGTMRKRLKDSPAASRARLKTGSLHDVAALAGYVPDANGKLCVVVGMVNTDLVAHGKGRAVLDALVDWVARSGGPVQQPVAGSQPAQTGNQQVAK
ncbi:D-alanyl-D-alanine carboxypeptidase/D-alanyl-D-alanine-endopeptidase [Massilia terrae]|uniref:D-alanyl-D-alanine carboxypeptidase/D-alanyl-D-alanine-endopeptidase n=1 Tax=Massilia terrae TaxID=1811224 RepID=A0ABT2D3A3_9BURK|nr:D-alanyl-D-alanine carboxypeptidase/D-alanyl-D-alanine-endopeptidase [Massilia terrae]MCS0659870.1 D-alanyl-D-alanine carboxypeptidase/D-alanyl-D-alanine-endopeptidase [Massilia terrae]